MFETDGQIVDKHGVQADRVTQVEYLKDSLSKAVSITTDSKTLEELLGEALPSTVLAVTLVVLDEEIRYNPVGEADATNSLLPAVYTIWGTKAILDLVEFYSASSLPMGIIVNIPNTEM